jgi:pyrroloquinoline quinone biosynthesis protein B
MSALGSMVLALSFALAGNAKATAPACQTSLYVLGTSQDAGKPQIGQDEDPAWQDPSQAKMATSIAIVERNSGARYLFDATPDIKAQLYALDKLAKSTGFRLDGIFLTHAHIGHYLGLAQLGREAMGAKSIPVYAMPEMRKFLEQNGPWSLLVKLKNIVLIPLENQHDITPDQDLTITPFRVPHRAEYTETIGYKIRGGGKSAIYLPDIDSWEQWDAKGVHIEAVIKANDWLFLDASFFSGDELPGRDMSKIPHPTIMHSMDRFKTLPQAQKAKIRFIHLNHSNPAHDPKSAAYQTLTQNGFKVAQSGEQYCLD